MALPVIKIEQISHNGTSRIGLFFDYDEKLIQVVKEFPDRKWSQTKKCWHLPVTKNYKSNLFFKFKGIAYLKFINPKPGDTISNQRKSNKAPYKDQLADNTRKKLTELKGLMTGRRYSKSTINNYISLLETFFGFYKNVTPDQISLENIENYNFKVIIKHNYSVVYQRQLVNALKVFYKFFPSENFQLGELERPRNEKKIPEVLSHNEVLQLFMATPNLKHRCILVMLYSCGLRIGELLNLKIGDIDFDRKQLKVRMGKGKKDRAVSLSTKIYGLMNNYLNSYTPKVFMFNGQRGGKYSAVSVRKFLAVATKKLG